MNKEIPGVGRKIKWISPGGSENIGTVVPGFVVKWSDEPEDIGAFLPNEDYEILPAETTLEIDFTAKELEMIAKGCLEQGISFSEFIDQAIRKAVEGHEA